MPRKISYIPAFLSISLVMLLAGLFSVYLLNASKFKRELRENVQFSVYFKDEAIEADIQRVLKELESHPYVLKADTIGKERGLAMITKDVGENPEKLLGYNPIPASIDVRFRESFVVKDSLSALKKRLEQNKYVREVSYDSGVIEGIDKNIRTAALVLLSLAALLTLVSVALINNTIRLTVYSKRFIVKSMQYVGATQSFIRRPFIRDGIVLGLASGLMAILFLMGLLWVLVYFFPVLEVLENPAGLIGISVTLLLAAMVISGFSAYFAINKYLRMKIDDLF